ncbi:hypothetical protein [Sphingopyxis sp. JAI128]|uniref:hypothetical protein n=1 Tax=Sphingopyxis sp. JAI128 TaxID=2723066 RepID=UPI00161062E9|nr:hypothetical protein [Sphingopyxis sp. JAI128]MBB6428175.1 hypothetical protein [Sphingopyxis sp. JAI128]
MFKKIACLLVPAFILAACQERDDLRDEDSDNIKSIASALPLKERYDLYVEIYSSDIPPNKLLAKEVASLGRPAFKMAVDRASKGNEVDISSSIVIIDNYNENYKSTCLEGEYMRIKSRIERKFENAQAKDHVISRLKRACRIGHAN